MKPVKLSLARARRIWLTAQRLDRIEPFGSGAAATRAAVEHLGYVQIDTINVVERCHHHILFTRIPNYRRDDLRQAQSVQERVATLGEVPGYVDFLFVEQLSFDPRAWEKVMVTAAPHAEAMLDAAIDAYADPDLPWEPEVLVARLGELGEANEVPKKQRQAAVRIATTGRGVGPPLGESLVLLGRDEVLTRLRAARELVGRAVPGGGGADEEPGQG